VNISHRFVDANGVRLHVAECGSGPLVILCHGFPESWYSWRHQLSALANAGFHAVAPDMRGYGQSDRPDEIEQYTLLHLTGDMIALADAMRAESAVIAGHDWGAPVAWHAALLRPDRFRAVIGLSVPFRPRGAKRPTSTMPQNEREQFYQLYFQAPGVAEAELQADVRRSIRTILMAASGDVPPSGTEPAIHPLAMVPRSGGFLTRWSDPQALPSWLSEADVEFYTSEFERTGFRGGLNWYRNIDRNWELLAPFAGSKIDVPAMFVAGERDLVVNFPGARELLANMRTPVPQLRRSIILPGCGHWTQQERADEVSTAMINFLRSL
jgi:pimeloyl-ACP methyl ester carboxylesterase